MSEEGLRETVEATMALEQQELFAQQGGARILGHMALVLAELYREHRQELDDCMAKEPKTNSHSSKTYQAALQKWETHYNDVNQKWQAKETQWNATIQSTNQEQQTMGTTAQQTSQSATYCTQPLNCTARLLQSSL